MFTDECLMATLNHGIVRLCIKILHLSPAVAAIAVHMEKLNSTNDIGMWYPDCEISILLKGLCKFWCVGHTYSGSFDMNRVF